MQQFRQLLRTQRECILHRYASADVPCCAYRVPSAASGLLYSSCGRNRRYPHRCRSRHRNSTMKPSYCRSQIRSPSRPGHIRVRAGFLCKFDLVADDFRIDQVGWADSPVRGACRGIEQDVHLVAHPALMPVKFPVQPDRTDTGRLLLEPCTAEGHGMVFGIRAVNAKREIRPGDDFPHHAVVEEKLL